MLAGIRKRLTRRHFDIKECEDEDKNALYSAFVPPSNYIKISQGKIQLVHQSNPLDNQAAAVHQKPSQEVLESRIVELEGALLRIQEKVNNSQCGSPTFEKELREQLETMHRVIKMKERKTIQTSRDHKILQARFSRQESLLQSLQLENRNLVMRIRQYEHCLDDVMRKVVDAIVAEDSLREEVSLLKGRVRDLEEQNAALSASPAKGRDEGYCTMSSGQPPPPNVQLEDLPEEPEQWLLPAEPCSTEMEDWSLSQEELAGITLNDERGEQLQLQQQQHNKIHSDHDWILDSNDFMSSAMGVLENDSASDGISQLLQQKIVYSEDEDVACTEFTNDFYKLVNIRSSDSTSSLYSNVECETDDEDDDDDDDECSLTEGSDVRLLRRIGLSDYDSVKADNRSEADHVIVTSCSSSESEERSRCCAHRNLSQKNLLWEKQDEASKIEGVLLNANLLSQKLSVEDIVKEEFRGKPLSKSKSFMEERKKEKSCLLLRNNQPRETESSVASLLPTSDAALDVDTKLGLSACQKPANCWRKSNGWRRLTSPAITTTPSVSPKKETKTGISRAAQLPQKMFPTRIPTCIPPAPAPAQVQQQTSLLIKQQQQHTHKSKIPPPVPVRRSYAC